MAEYRIACFNDDGINEFEALLFDAKRGGMSAERLQDLVAGWWGTRRYLSSMNPKVTIDDMFPCTNRFELAGYLLPRLERLGVPMQPGTSHRGLWIWLTAALLEADRYRRWELQHSCTGIIHPVVELKTVVQAPHLLCCLARHAYGDSSVMMLNTKPGVHADIIEQLQTGSVLGNAGVVDAAYRLFWDSEAEGLKVGHAPTDRSIPGLRRFKDKLNQIGCTYDLRKMDSDEVIRFMPEFVERFGLDH